MHLSQTMIETATGHRRQSCWISVWKASLNSLLYGGSCPHGHQVFPSCTFWHFNGTGWLIGGLQKVFNKTNDITESVSFTNHTPLLMPKMNCRRNLNGTKKILSLRFNSHCPSGAGSDGIIMSPFWIYRAKDDGRGGDNWSYCKVPVKSSPPTNQHSFFLSPNQQCQSTEGKKTKKRSKQEID